MSQINAYIHFIGTGELKETTVRLRSNERFTKNFFIGMSEGYMLLAQLDLTGSQLKVLLLLISQMEYQNICYVTQSFITKITGISQPNVSKHINKMIQMGLIFKESTPKGNALRINAVISWKGTRNNVYKERFMLDSQCLKIPSDVILHSFEFEQSI
jgi:DNA-binding MarR family transcriptional regulator